MSETVTVKLQYLEALRGVTPPQAPPVYSGGGLFRVSPGQIVEVRQDVAKQLLNDFPNAWEVASDVAVPTQVGRLEKRAPKSKDIKAEKKPTNQPSKTLREAAVEAEKPRQTRQKGKGKAEPVVATEEVTLMEEELIRDDPDGPSPE